MDQRKAAILEAVVEQYVRTGQPVGSQAIARAGDLGISAATVRNELMFLEREGYITHPHTSAGRVPTDRGYRFFVDHFAPPRELAPSAHQAVADFFAREHLELEVMLQATSRLLSQVTRCAAVVVSPPTDVAVLRALQLVRLHGSLVLVVTVLSGGVVDKQLLEIGEDVDDGTIAAASSALAAQLTQASLTDLPELSSTGDPLVDQLARQARDALVARVGATDSGPVYVGGASCIAAEPGAFSAFETVTRLLELLERQYLVVSLARGLLGEGVTVRIGSENSLGELSECSVVLARYSVDDRAAGTLGVLGPTRMDYPGVMAGVAAVSRRLGEHLSRLS